MSWYEKKHTSPLEASPQPIDGLVFLDGDILARLLGIDWTRGQKYPQITFPSGTVFDIWETANPLYGGIIHYFGEFDLPARGQTRDEAFERANDIAEQVGYLARKVGDNKLEAWGPDPDEHVLITYDNVQKRVIDVEKVTSQPVEKPIHPGHVLMNDAIRAQLPPLYSQEEKGLDAIAPVKYFHVNGWTWFPVEYEPETGVFFGLVVGFEIEQGYFSLEELMSIGADGRVLPVERDLYYQPRSLREIRDDYQRQRGE